MTLRVSQSDEISTDIEFAWAHIIAFSGSTLNLILLAAPHHAEIRAEATHAPQKLSREDLFFDTIEKGAYLSVPDIGVVPESSTQSVGFRDVEAAVSALMETSSLEELEPGFDTSLMPALYELVRAYGTNAVLALAATIESGEMDAQLAAWILRWLGHIPDSSTHSVRRWLLERSLQSSVPMVRDGAADGLAWLGDACALTALKAAIGSERYSRIKRSIQGAIEQLERV
jgi:hypothetical protein